MAADVPDSSGGQSHPLVQPKSPKTINYLKSNQQYIEKKPASILVASKLDHFKSELGSAEALE